MSTPWWIWQNGSLFTLMMSMYCSVVIPWLNFSADSVIWRLLDSGFRRNDGLTCRWMLFFAVVCARC